MIHTHTAYMILLCGYRAWIFIQNGQPASLPDFFHILYTLIYCDPSCNIKRRFLLKITFYFYGLDNKMLKKKIITIISTQCFSYRVVKMSLLKIYQILNRYRYSYQFTNILNCIQYLYNKIILTCCHPSLNLNYKLKSKNAQAHIVINYYTLLLFQYPILYL